MRSFDCAVAAHVDGLLVSCDISTIQVNLGLMCNQSCAHCHLGASPGRPEMMDRPTMELVVEAANRARPSLVDLTGGAPELNPQFRWLVEELTAGGHAVQVRTNLTAMLEPGMEDMPVFLREMGAGLVGSMPCYLEENVRAQRGMGAYERSVEVIRRLNALGYGGPGGPSLDLVYNPGGAFLPPVQAALEADYRRELDSRFGIRFTRLLTITNMPIGRFWARMKEQQRDTEYMGLLDASFNPDTIDGLMCRHQVSVGWDGSLYDCDFNLALGMPVAAGAPSHIREFEPDRLIGRRVVTGPHCFGCTAGCGSSCKGALV